MPPKPSLVEIDSLEIQIIIDNELDPLSQPAPDTVQLAGGTMPLIALSTSPSLQPGERGNAVKEFRMEDICCSAHGLSIMIVRSVNSSPNFLLDRPNVGPEIMLTECIDCN